MIRKLPTKKHGYNLVLVSIIHRKNRREILLIRRKRNPGKDMWSLPGGTGSLGKETDLGLAVKKEVRSDFSVEYLNYNLFAVRARKIPEPTIYL